MGNKLITTYLTRLLDLAWWLGAVSAGLLFGLLAWSQIAEPPALSSFALEIGLSGFSIERPSGDTAQNVTLTLPISLEVAAGANARADLKNVRADYRFPIRKGPFVSLSLAILLSLMLLVVWIVDQLRQVFRTLQHRDPFVAENAVRIRRMGIGVILIEIVRSGAVLFWSYSASSLVAADGAPFVPATRFGSPALLYGLIIMAVAEVFREGTRLKEEQSLTI